MIIVCTGSRHWTNYDQIDAVIKGLANKRHSIGDTLTVVHGKAKNGVDMMVDAAARKYADEVIPEPAKWREKGFYNPSAGFERNEYMLDEYKPDVLVAFRSLGKSNGTDHCIKEAKLRKIPVIKYIERKGSNENY